MKQAILALGLLLGGTAACFAQAGAANGAPAGDAARGRALFVQDGCYECHGYVGQGSIRTAPALAPKPAPYATFTAQLREPADRMPAYTEKVLSDAQMADLYAYLVSLPPSPDPASIALLQQ